MTSLSSAILSITEDLTSDPLRVTSTVRDGKMDITIKRVNTRLDNRCIQIGNLEGKSNWDTWKYKATCLLRTVPQAYEVVQGIMKVPLAPKGTDMDEIKKFTVESSEFLKIDASALLILTTNMSDDILRKVMHLEKSHDVWVALHNMFSEYNEDKVYKLCMRLLRTKKQPTQLIGSHIDELRAIWGDLNNELAKGNSVLPEFLLQCIVLCNLDRPLAPFRAPWLKLPKVFREIETLSCHLTGFERGLQTPIELD